MQVFFGRFVDFCGFLGHDQNHSVFSQGLIDCSYRLFAIHEERDDHVWEDHQVGHGENRQCFGDCNLRLFLGFIRAFVFQYFHGLVFSYLPILLFLIRVIGVNDRVTYSIGI